MSEEKEYSTLAEIQRCCKMVASTAVDHRLYNAALNEARRDKGEFHFVAEHEAISVYSNGYHHLVVEHFGNILTLWRLR